MSELLGRCCPIGFAGCAGLAGRAGGAAGLQARRAAPPWAEAPGGLAGQRPDVQAVPARAPAERPGAARAARRDERAAAGAAGRAGSGSRRAARRRGAAVRGGALGRLTNYSVRRGRRSRRAGGGRGRLAQEREPAHEIRGGRSDEFRRALAVEELRVGDDHREAEQIVERRARGQEGGSAAVTDRPGKRRSCQGRPCSAAAASTTRLCSSGPSAPSSSHSTSPRSS